MATVNGLLSSDQITSLIQQASARFQAPATALQAQEKPIQTQISALGTVQAALSSLQSALAGFADVQKLSDRSVTTSPTGAVQANVTNDAAIGNYSLSGIHLAQAESLVSAGSPSTSGGLGAGSIAIQLGGADAVTINVADGQSSLAGIAAAIDQADAGVQASVIFDGSAYHLVLTGAVTGSANAFTVSGTGGLAGLSYSPSASGGLTLTQAAANSSFSLNGIAITSGSNTVAGVVPGLTFTLAASGSATVAVAQSVSALHDAAQGLVSALNQALGTINQFSSYSPTSGAGPLLGNVGLQIIRNDLLNAISGAPGGGVHPNAAYTSLSSVGFRITSDGTVTLDDAAFQTAASSNYAAVVALLGEAGTATNADVSVQRTGSVSAGTYSVNVTANSAGSITGTVNGQVAGGTDGLLLVTGSGPAQGLALQITAGVTGDLGSVTISQGLFGSLNGIVTAALANGTGSVSSQLSGLNSTITSMNQQILSLSQEAQQQTLTLTRQFSAAQATLSQLSTVSAFLTTYFNMASGGSGG